MSTLSVADYPSKEAIRFLTAQLRTIPDFPKPGIQFKDITPLLASGPALRMTLDLLSTPFLGAGITHVVGMEARGFIFGAAVADRLGAGFVPVRKPGKLPGEVDEVSYDLEYGSNTLQLHKGTFNPHDRVLIIDDLLATGGTAAATAQLVQAQKAHVHAYAFVCELDFLAGREALAAASSGASVYSLIHIGGD